MSVDDLRRLTGKERQEIRALVYQCANYVRQDKYCVLFDVQLDRVVGCPMLKITGVGKVCGYFRKAVLPLNPILEAALTYTEPTETRQCALCGGVFVPKNNRQQFCGDKCKAESRKRNDREWRKKQREKQGLMS